MKKLFLLLSFITTVIIVGCDLINDSNNEKILSQKDILGKYVAKYNLISVDETGKSQSIKLINDTIKVYAINATRIKYESKILGVFYGVLNLDKATTTKLPVTLDEQPINSALISTPKNDLVLKPNEGSSFDFGKGKIEKNSQLKVFSKSKDGVTYTDDTEKFHAVSLILDSETRDIEFISSNTGG